MIFHMYGAALFAVALPHSTAQHISHSINGGRPTCIVHSGESNSTDDVPLIIEAFERCGHGGNVIFSENETYHINSRLNPVVNDVNIDWHGKWEVKLSSTLSPAFTTLRILNLTLSSERSFPKTSNTGATTHTASNSKTTLQASS